MKKILIVLFFLVTNCLSLCAQSKYFEKSVGWQYIHNGWRIFEKQNGGYLVFGDSRGLNITIWSPYSLHLDNDGVLLDTIQYELPDNYNTACTNGIATEYGYVLSGLISHNEQPLSAQCYVIRITPDGGLIDTVWVGKQYSQSNSITRTFDGGYLLGGYSRAPTEPSNHPYLIRLNANMEVVWDSTYIIPTVGFGLGAFTKLISNTTDNTYYALAIVSSDPTTLVWLHINDSGAILGNHIFPSTPYDWLNNIASISIWGKEMIRCKDGDFVLGISEIQLGDVISCYLLKLSPNGDTIRWKKEIDSTAYVSKIYQLADSSFILGGSVSTLPPDTISLECAVAHVSKDGDLLWKRLYGGTENDYIYDFIPTTDGSYFFTGRTESNLPNGGANVYLLKTNCMGLLTQPQANFTTQIDSAALTASFQNLSQFVYPDSIDGGRFIWDFGDGATSSELNPTHIYEQGGQYAVSLTAIVCSDTSVFVQAVNTWAVGVSQIPHWQQVSALHPNPAQNTATFEHRLATGQTGKLNIYDLTGKQLSQYTFVGSGQQQFSVAYLPAGMYLYTVQIDELVVQQAKLVLIP